ncbi:hypothetical protein LTR70_010154 [Exophiala xenobiotica]|uniref:Alkylmercury lyase n=1 Tax=Lithohypha guttulata TaxID=1690604 RepID=A0ABR0JUZ0_9EURO|nr:hypothetical protein LTR24_010111 [Lithohypha guttulata]KAK5309586.1 hypothetical protein LTR70_010154 [Exophiala xenobiotica]
MTITDEGLPFAVEALLQGRRAPGEQGLRVTQFAILSSLTASGRLPATTIIEDIAGELSKTSYEILCEMHKRDYVRVDKSGSIIAAYPFSIRPTRHRVELENGVTVFAMCAIDALGIPPMANSDATIYSSTDSGIEVRVIFRQQQISWDPPETVVLIGTETPAGAAADVCCQHVNFFANRTTAEAWAKAHPEIEGTILSQGRAIQLATAIFEADEERPQRYSGKPLCFSYLWCAVHLYEVVQRLDKGSKVKELMKAITEDAQNLVNNYHTVKSVSPELCDKLEEIVKEMDTLEPSLPTENDVRNNFFSGGGSQYVHTGSGAQKINNSSGYIGEYSGSGNLHLPLW